jgi:hypothetical protein
MGLFAEPSISELAGQFVHGVRFWQRSLSPRDWEEQDRIGKAGKAGVDPKFESDRSREGRSAEWVLAALSDFRGQIQARDIVRLIKIAAAASIGTTGWTDRLLAPQAIRDAVAECSTEKIKEISEENVQLKRIFERLKELPDESRSIPFTSEQVALDAQG